MAIFIISKSSVAVKSSVCLPDGVMDAILLTSSMKPMSSMRSASSRTSIFKDLRLMLPRSRWSRSLPGVATTMSHWASCLNCSRYGIPPSMQAVRTLMYLP